MPGRGFTLIELVTVVAIVAVLAAMAMSSYSNYAFRARRAEGREMLMRVASAQERYFTNFNRYGTLVELRFGNAVASERGHYTIAATLGANDQTFTLSATPTRAQLKDKCGTLTIDNAGAKGPAPAPSHTNGACW
ncbi:type IV pilin protein [Tahibacter soli]|uniref:Type IV pilin protein n=1 Tax=Tahibacter soli TaxID=2983605 RepID=A0A9X3YPM4_9GAMM|nr:type IV pilin protein [Tahibacter soli]MDC8015649.1 type IV pilin protein [Tahibacter soli]